MLAQEWQWPLLDVLEADEAGSSAMPVVVGHRGEVLNAEPPSVSRAQLDISETVLTTPPLSCRL